jgi:uncharacterized protein YndB with AHSA1/START domain
MSPAPPPLVRSDRRHRFDVGPEELWAAVVRVQDYRSWWPWLGGLEQAAFAEGERWRCVVRPPLPYVLRFELLLEEVEAPRFVTATIEGDLTGHAALDITPVGGDGSELRLVSALAPANGALQLAARAAPLLVRFGHDWVLDTGLRQFRDRALSPGRAPGGRGRGG